MLDEDESRQQNQTILSRLTVRTLTAKNDRKKDNEAYSPQRHYNTRIAQYNTILECGPMPNLMVALPNIDGALCSTPQSLADAHY